jgi:putative transposase
MKSEVAADIRKIFNAPDRPTAELYLSKAVQKYAKTASKLSDWMEANIPEGLRVLASPVSHQRKLRTTKLLERLNREIRRRTRVVSIFPILTWPDLLHPSFLGSLPTTSGSL